jgi:MerR family transcriptional regulator, light-induced transcriptional regulator
MAKRQPPIRDYPIRAVARMTGIGIDTLRAWERRYRAVVPRRNDRGRLYTEADVTRLKRLAELVARGHAIGTIATLPDGRLERLLETSEALRDAPAPPAPAAALEVLTPALEAYDLDAIEAILGRHAAMLSPTDFVFEVVLPLLREIGRRWEAGQLRPSQEHLVSAIVRTVLGALLRTIARPDASPKVLFATPAGERHELGLLCAALLTASAGYGVVYLGADLPAADVAHAAAASGAAVVILGATTQAAVSANEARALTRALGGRDLWVGGPEAKTLLAAFGDRGRHIDGLDQVPRLLARHVR